VTLEQAFELATKIRPGFGAKVRADWQRQADAGATFLKATSGVSIERPYDWIAINYRSCAGKEMILFLASDDVAVAA
jgi:hypothetical protein